MSDHFDGKRFFNPQVDTDRNLGEMVQWMVSRRPPVWPRHAGDPGPAPIVPVAKEQIVATYVGQATFLLQSSGFNVLTDPIFSQRASPSRWIGPRRVRDPALAIDALPPIDLVLLSHNHYDHMDLPSLRRLRARWAMPIVTGLGNGAYLATKGIDGAIELDWWQSCAIGSGARVTFVPAQHWSKRGLFDRRRMLWGGHFLELPAGSVYFAGDTGYPAHFAEIAKRLGAPDIALLPIGAYEPRWFMGPQHMNPDEAVRAHGDLGAGHSIAMHFATFPLADEAIDAPARELAAALVRHRVLPGRFRLPAFGQPIVWPEPETGG